MNRQPRNDMGVDALVRRLDVEQRPLAEFVDETYELLRAHASEARRRDASVFGRLLDALPSAPPRTRTPAAWRPLLIVALTLLALLAGLTFLVGGLPLSPPQQPANHILFGRGHPGTEGADLWVVGKDGSNPHLLVAGTNEVSRVSPDGTQILSPVHGALVFPRLYRLDGSIARDLHPTGDLSTLNLGVATWSHDGQWLAFEAWDETLGDRNGVYLMRIDGSELHRLTGSGIPGDFSPDDRQIVVARQEGLFVLNVDGTDEHQVGTVRPVAYSSPGFMPDGRSLYAAADGRIWIIDIATGQVRSIEVPGGNINLERLSPDGTTFTFTFDAAAASTTAIWIMDVDGSRAHMVVDDPTVGEDYSDWLP